MSGSPGLHNDEQATSAQSLLSKGGAGCSQMQPNPVLSFRRKAILKSPGRMCCAISFTLANDSRYANVKLMAKHPTGAFQDCLRPSQQERGILINDHSVCFKIGRARNKSYCAPPSLLAPAPHDESPCTKSAYKYRCFYRAFKRLCTQFSKFFKIDSKKGKVRYRLCSLSKWLTVQNRIH